MNIKARNEVSLFKQFAFKVFTNLFENSGKSIFCGPGPEGQNNGHLKSSFLLGKIVLSVRWVDYVNEYWRISS